MEYEKEQEYKLSIENTKDYFVVFEAIEKRLQEGIPIIIAIDGQCGSGKGTLADILSKRYECNIFHMDDYFLPPMMKTKERLSQAGGNVHYERFKTEILDSLVKQEPVTYRPYSCKEERIGEPIHVAPKLLSIVEGSYCLHPSLRKVYDFRIFLTVDSLEQHRRIRKRNGEEKLQQFIKEWIPLEEHYFQKLDIKNLCNLVLDTTNIKASKKEIIK